MVKRIWLFVLLLAVPIIGFGAATAIQLDFNSDLHQAIQQQFPDAPKQQLAGITVNGLCQQNIAEFKDLCDMNNNLNLIRKVSIAAGIFGLLLLLSIRLAGKFARNSRALLVALFVPGLYVTLIILVGLIAAHAGIAIGSIYYGESVLFGQIHVKILAAIGLGALAGIWAMAKNTFTLVKKAETYTVGKALTRVQAPHLWQLIDTTAEKLGALQPNHLVVGLDPNFFVTEADVICLDGKLQGRTLYCSLPLCRILSKDEVTSVIGHELGHFRGDDTKFSKRFYPVYRGTTTSLAALQNAGRGLFDSIALFPAFAVLGYFLECFAVAESRLGRERELAADQAGAEVASAHSIASALVKLHTFTEAWDKLCQNTVESLRQGRTSTNMSKAYAEFVHSNNPANLDELNQTHLTHPTDSHPSLSERLEPFHLTITDISASALVTSPADSVVALLDDMEKLEEDISKAYQQILADSHQIAVKDAETVSEANIEQLGA